MKNIIVEERKSLLGIAKKHIREMESFEGFEVSDYIVFGEMVQEFETLESLEIKPYLVNIHSNIWFAHLDFIYEVMEYLGYEEVGRMIDSDEVIKYNFDAYDETYECLYRLKSINADYTKTLKINH